MSFHPIEYVKHNPVVGGLGVFAIGLAVLYFLGFFKSAPADNGAGAYYAATVADATSGNQLQSDYVNAAAATAQAGIAADAYATVQSKWADTQLAITNSNNDVAPTLADAQTEQYLIGGLTQLAGQTQTVQSKNNGFFGIGGSKSTTVAPTPLATSSGDALATLLHNMELNTVH